MRPICSICYQLIEENLKASLKERKHLLLVNKRVHPNFTLELSSHFYGLLTIPYVVEFELLSCDKLCLSHDNNSKPIE